MTVLAMSALSISSVPASSLQVATYLILTAVLLLRRSTSTTALARESISPDSLPLTPCTLQDLNLALEGLSANHSGNHVSTSARCITLPSTQQQHDGLSISANGFKSASSNGQMSGLQAVHEARRGQTQVQSRRPSRSNPLPPLRLSLASSARGICSR